MQKWSGCQAPQGPAVRESQAKEESFQVITSLGLLHCNRTLTHHNYVSHRLANIRNKNASWNLCQKRNVHSRKLISHRNKSPVTALIYQNWRSYT